jgi:hypothetical protein
MARSTEDFASGSATVWPLRETAVQSCSRWGDEADRRGLNGLTENSEDVQICDTIILQLRDLMRSRDLARKLTSAELDSLTGQDLRGVALEG